VLVLALDTSSAAISVAVAEVHGTPRPTSPDADTSWGQTMAHIVRRSVVNPRGHGELLSPTIAAALDEAGATPRDLGAIVAGVGPGPYTGLRVGLVSAAAMADALGIPTYGVCSLDGYYVSHPGKPDTIVVTDARRKEVYWARYDAAGNRVEGPFVDRPADVPDAGAATGAGARLYPEIFGEPVGDDYPDPVRLMELARGRIVASAPSEPLTPLYLRHPDAVVPGAPKTVRQ
jgi:tRNA threonylcarbamoyl adenosine modification protein YeaZ